MASLPHLETGETALLEFANDDPRDVVSLSEKEALILRLFNQTQEQELERAFLEQEPEPVSDGNVDEQLSAAERELLEARATFTVSRKAVSSFLITDPILKAVHLKTTSPAERSLLHLINRRDVLSLAHENLATAHDTTLRTLSNRETENLLINKRNQQLAHELLELTRHDPSWKEEINDEDLKAQLRNLETEQKKLKAKWENMKGVASAIVVGSGVNWAEEETLKNLVLDD